MDQFLAFLDSMLFLPEAPPLSLFPRKLFVGNINYQVNNLSWFIFNPQ